MWYVHVKMYITTKYKVHGTYMKMTLQPYSSVLGDCMELKNTAGQFTSNDYFDPVVRLLPQHYIRRITLETYNTGIPLRFVGSAAARSCWRRLKEEEIEY